MISIGQAIAIAVAAIGIYGFLHSNRKLKRIRRGYRKTTQTDQDTKTKKNGPDNK